VTVFPNNVWRFAGRVTDDVNAKQAFVNFFDKALFLVLCGWVDTFIDIFNLARLIRISKVL
jgi:hypothetical protein